MLSISSKSRYGIQAVMTLAENHGKGLLQVKDIAQRNNISLPYLVQIFSLLVKAEIINSVRGKNGGYKLARDPSEITVLDIFETLEGEVEFVEKRSTRAGAVEELLTAAETQLRDAFKVTLAQLLARQQQMDHILTFDI